MRVQSYSYDHTAGRTRGLITQPDRNTRENRYWHHGIAILAPVPAPVPVTCRYDIAILYILEIHFITAVQLIDSRAESHDGVSCCRTAARTVHVRAMGLLAGIVVPKGTHQGSEARARPLGGECALDGGHESPQAVHFCLPRRRRYLP